MVDSAADYAELDVLSYLGKGRKARPVMAKPGQYNHRKSEKQHTIDNAPSKVPQRSLADLVRTAKKTPQAIFKISSYGKGKANVLEHLSYISRNAKLTLEDQDGHLIQSRREQRSLIEEWEMDFGTNKRSRDTVHMVLSTPPGTDRLKAQAAAQAFLKKEFGQAKHPYVFVAHHDTDHPHIHAVVKMVSDYGRKLNPRKAYLNALRERFAEACREQGIQVEASRRFERGLCGQSDRSEIVQIKRTQRQSTADLQLVQRVGQERKRPQLAAEKPWEQKTQLRNRIIRRRYYEAAQELVQSAKTYQDEALRTKTQAIAKVLDDFAKEMPIAFSRTDKFHQHLDKIQGLSQIRNRYEDHKSLTLREYELIASSTTLKINKSAGQQSGQESEVDMDVDD